MPPAFNLSQDQTLQFNLCLKTHSFGIEVNFTTSEFHFVFREYLVITLAITANFHQTPTLIGCQFLKNIADATYCFAVLRCSCYQRRSEIITRFCLSCQASAQLFLSRRAFSCAINASQERQHVAPGAHVLPPTPLGRQSPCTEYRGF